MCMDCIEVFGKEEVVRVGSRSQEEELKHVNLRSILQRNAAIRSEQQGPPGPYGHLDNQFQLQFHIFFHS